MEDFLKEFKDNLANRSEPDFEPGDWEKLQGRLDQQGGKRFAAFSWWWVLWPFLLLLVGTNAYFFLELKKANAKIAAIEVSRDNVVHTRVVYIRDTIYQTRVTHETVYINAETGTQTNIPNLETFSKEYFLRANPEATTSTAKAVPAPILKPEAALLPLLQKENSLIGPFSEERDTNVFLTVNELKHNEVNALQVSPVHPNLVPEMVVEAPLLKPTKTLRQQLYALRPKAFQLGLSGGWASPIDVRFDKKSGYSLGVHTAIDFSSQLSIWADASFFKIQQLSYRMGEDIGIPVVFPPSDAYTFSKAEAPQSYFQYSLGLQYVFHSKTKIKPMLGMGYGVVSLLPREIIYEFNNTATGVQWDYGYDLKIEPGLDDFTLFSAGLQYQLSPQWNFIFKTNYRSNLGKKEAQVPKLFGIESGINLRLGK